MADQPTPADPEPSPADTEPTGAVSADPIGPVSADPIGPVNLEPDYTDSGVPTFESVREKIETRYGTALGSAELDAETPEGRSVDEQYEARRRAAAEKLEQIRASMREAGA